MLVAMTAAGWRGTGTGQVACRGQKSSLTKLPSGAATPGLQLPELTPGRGPDPDQPWVPGCPGSGNQGQSPHPGISTALGGDRACKPCVQTGCPVFAGVPCRCSLWHGRRKNAFCRSSLETQKTYLMGGGSASRASLGPVPVLPRCRHLCPSLPGNSALA